MFNFLKSKKRKNKEKEEKEKNIANKAISEAINESNFTKEENKCNCKSCVNND